jgi:DNA polymerase
MGFFTATQLKSTSRPSGQILSCASCGLYRNALSPKMGAYGRGRKKIMIIGESFNEVEDKTGKPWQGKTGLLLKRSLEELGIDLFEDCISVNACRCRPVNKDGEDRGPENNEVACCSKFLFEDIKRYEPNVIIVLGSLAGYALLNNRWKHDLGEITKWRGFTIPDQELEAWVCPTYHPSYVVREEQDVSIKLIWEDDLKCAIDLATTVVPKNKEPKITVLQDLSPLNGIHPDLIAFDYETTGIKPHAKGHRIVCAAVADTADHAFVFLMPRQREERQPFLNVLDDNLIGKIAHNVKYEDTWSMVRLGQKIKNWAFDTMLASHLLDNRPGVTGLKFQVYVNFGIIDYDSEVAPYIKSIGDDSDGSNSLNKIHAVLQSQQLTNKLLEYCAKDAIYTYRLALKQMKTMDYTFLPF